MGEELEVQIDMKNGYIVKAKEMFVYKHDPWIAQVYPLSTFLMWVYIIVSSIYTFLHSRAPKLQARF